MMDINMASHPDAGSRAAGLPANSGSKLAATRHGGWLLELERALLALNGHKHDAARTGSFGRDAPEAGQARSNASAVDPAAALETATARVEGADSLGSMAGSAIVRPVWLHEKVAVAMSAISTISATSGHGPANARANNVESSPASGRPGLGGNNAGSPYVTFPAAGIATGELSGVAQANTSLQASLQQTQPTQPTQYDRPSILRDAGYVSGYEAEYGGALQTRTRGAPIDVVQIFSAARPAGDALRPGLPAQLSCTGQADYPDIATPDERMPDAAEYKRPDTAPSAHADPYARRHLHLHRDEDSVQAWLRDADLADTQTSAVILALESELSGAGLKLGTVTLNGKAMFGRAPGIRAPSARAVDIHVQDFWESAGSEAKSIRSGKALIMTTAPEDAAGKARSVLTNNGGTVNG